VKNQVLADAANYALKQAPAGALKMVGVDPTGAGVKLGQMLEARLEQAPLTHYVGVQGVSLIGEMTPATTAQPAAT
jgi:hypothetical protein